MEGGLDWLVRAVLRGLRCSVARDIVLVIVPYVMILIWCVRLWLFLGCELDRLAWCTRLLIVSRVALCLLVGLVCDVLPINFALPLLYSVYDLCPGP